MDDRGKRLDPEDVALWAAVTEDVTLLKGRERPIVPAPAAPKPSKAKKIPAPLKPAPASTKTSVPLIGSGIDARTRQKLERGQMSIEGVLDLHGHGRDEGQRAVTAFLMAAYHSGKRCVLVITGKGKWTKNEQKPWWDSERGVLKTSFKNWVQEPPLNQVVLETAQAKGKDGGAGAFYVLLRQKRGPGQP